MIDISYIYSLFAFSFEDRQERENPKKVVSSGSMLPALTFDSRSFTTIRLFSKLKTSQSHKALHAKASANKHCKTRDKHETQ